MNEQSRSELESELEEARNYRDKVIQEVGVREAKVEEAKKGIALLRARRNEELSRDLRGVGSAQAFLSRDAYRKRINKEIEVLEKELSVLIEDLERAQNRLSEVINEIATLESLLIEGV